jgi:hypothetical protein
LLQTQPLPGIVSRPDLPTLLEDMGWARQPSSNGGPRREQPPDSQRPSSAPTQRAPSAQSPRPSPPRRRARDLLSLLEEEGVQGHKLNLAARPSRDIGRMHGGVEANCAICLESLRPTVCEPGSVQALACGHAFHTCCIQRWLSASPTCPLCKGKVVL